MGRQLRLGFDKGSYGMIPQGVHSDIVLTLTQLEIFQSQ